MQKDDEKWKIPEPLRASIDPADEAAYSRLLANDKEQAERAALVNSPFSRATPADVERAKAAITIQALSIVKRTPEQNEQFSEAWAVLGRFDVAAKVSKKNKKHYNALHKAVMRPDTDNCKCDDRELYIREHGTDKALIACNKCGFLNYRPAPEHLKRRHRAASVHTGKTKGMSIDECRKFHSDNVRQ